MADPIQADKVLQGRVWRFDDDISTDLLSPGAYAIDPVEVRKLHVLESINPEFASDVEPGDVIVAGRNFGCGSSRETAAENLKVLGVSCVVAESFARKHAGKDTSQLRFFHGGLPDDLTGVRGDKLGERGRELIGGRAQ